MGGEKLDPSEALRMAQGAARVGQCRMSVLHGRQRSRERNATVSDIRNAILTAKIATWREDDRSWRLSGGTDIDGDHLDVAVGIEGNEVRIITVL
jgi:hypothetical protein